MTPHFLLHGDLELSASEQRRRDLKHELVEVARRLGEQIVLLDAGSASEGELQELLGAVEAASGRADAIADHRERGGLNRAPGWEAALTERSPISGRSNPLAAPLTLVVEGDRTTAHACYTRAHEGPTDHLHGGVVVGAFDELLGTAQSTSGQAGYTGTITVRMRRPTPLHVRIDYEAGVDRVEGRKIFVWGRSLLGGELLCEAEGIFIAPAGQTHVEGYGQARSEA